MIMSDKLNKIQELKELLDSGAISQEEFDQLKKEVLEEKAMLNSEPAKNDIKGDIALNPKSSWVKKLLIISSSFLVVTVLFMSSSLYTDLMDIINYNEYVDPAEYEGNYEDSMDNTETSEEDYDITSDTEDSDPYQEYSEIEDLESNEEIEKEYQKIEKKELCKWCAKAIQNSVRAWVSINHENTYVNCCSYDCKTQIEKKLPPIKYNAKNF